MKIKIERSYKALRKEDYPPLTEQLDMMYKDKINGTTIWFDKIKEIKDKHPKKLDRTKDIT